MTFDINEARAIIEDAKKRGIIRAVDSDRDASSAPVSKPANETDAHAVIPDWLQEGIRQGPLVRPDTGRD